MRQLPWSKTRRLSILSLRRRKHWSSTTSGTQRCSSVPPARGTASPTPRRLRVRRRRAGGAGTDDRNVIYGVETSSCSIESNRLNGCGATIELTSTFRGIAGVRISNAEFGANHGNQGGPPWIFLANASKSRALSQLLGSASCRVWRKLGRWN